MHVIQILDADGRVISTRSRQERDEAYAAFDAACATALPGSTVIMREGGRVHRRHAVTGDYDDAGTDVPETASEPGSDVRERAGDENPAGSPGRGDGNTGSRQPKTRRSASVAAKTSVDEVPAIGLVLSPPGKKIVMGKKP